MNLFLIFLGGGLGACCRWLLSCGVQALALRTDLHRFPAGILVCNLLGCFLIGVLFGYYASRDPRFLFSFAVTGFLGGFTTFSTFGRDTLEAFRDGLPGVAVLNIILSVTLGIAAVWLGLRAGQALTPS